MLPFESSVLVASTQWTSSVFLNKSLQKKKKTNTLPHSDLSDQQHVGSVVVACK